MFSVELKIIPVPIRIWDLQVGDRFTLEPSGWNFENQRFEIYIKVTRTKAILDSVPEKPVFSIPKIAKGDVAYKLIEAWSLPKK